VPFDGIAQGRDARELEAGRRRDHPACSFGRGGEEDLSRGLEVAAALHPNRSAASVTLDQRQGRPGVPFPPSLDRCALSRREATDNRWDSSDVSR